jgi:hypothetical protein
VNVRTESFKLVTEKFNLRDARALIATQARLWTVEVNEIEERRHLVSVDLIISVTGPPKGIDGMRPLLAGPHSVRAEAA